MTKTIGIIGGGIAGNTCLQALVHHYEPETSEYSSIVLISASRLLKRVVNYTVKGRNIETFDVDPVDASYLTKLQVPHGLEIKFVQAFVKHVDATDKSVLLNCDDQGDIRKYHFDILAICSGSSPRRLKVPGADDPEVRKRLLTIRDTTSIKELKAHLLSCRRVAIVGNGGISLELVNKITDCEKVWILRDDHIGDPFLDSEASKFILNAHNSNTSTHDQPKPPCQYIPSESTEQEGPGPALGPDWLQHYDLHGNAQFAEKLQIIHKSEVVEFSSNVKDHSHLWPLSLRLTDGQQIDCDLVVSAIGVSPSVPTVLNGEICLSDSDGAILIDNQMRTSLSDIYAAGDVVSCDNWPANELWFQMRLWTQARQMGFYCGRCIAAHITNTDPLIYFNFDCFSHSTKFFGWRVVLLGRYNVQNICDKEASNIEILLRTKANKEYIKLVIKDNRTIGAILVGDSGLEETIENLICDRLNIEHIKNDLLDDTIDIEDYFD